MRRYIDLTDSEARKEICKLYKVTPASLSQALRFKRNSKKAIAMRAMAIEKGGTLFEESSNSKNIK